MTAPPQGPAAPSPDAMVGRVSLTPDGRAVVLELVGGAMAARVVLSGDGAIGVGRALQASGERARTGLIVPG